VRLEAQPFRNTRNSARLLGESAERWDRSAALRGSWLGSLSTLHGSRAVRLEHCNVRKVLVSSGRALVLEQHVATDYVERSHDELGFDATLPCLLERDAIDAREDVDAPRLPTEHEDLVSTRQLCLGGRHVSEAEVDERLPNLSRVSGR